MACIVHTTHSTSMVMYQVIKQHESGNRSSGNYHHKARKRSLELRPEHQRLLNYNAQGPRPKPVFNQQAQKRHFEMPSNVPLKTLAQMLDLAWLFLRLNSTSFENTTSTIQRCKLSHPGVASIHSDRGYLIPKQQLDTVHSWQLHLQSIVQSLRS